MALWALLVTAGGLLLLGVGRAIYVAGYRDGHEDGEHHGYGSGYDCGHSTGFRAGANHARMTEARAARPVAVRN